MGAAPARWTGRCESPCGMRSHDCRRNCASSSCCTYYAEYTVNDIAAALNLPFGTVYYRLRSAVDRLERTLRDEEGR